MTNAGSGKVTQKLHCSCLWTILIPRSMSKFNSEEWISRDLLSILYVQLASTWNIVVVIFSQTFNADAQIGESSACATALMCGVKTNFETVGLDARGRFENCFSSFQSRVSSLIDWAQQSGKHTPWLLFLYLFCSLHVQKTIVNVCPTGKLQRNRDIRFIEITHAQCLAEVCKLYQPKNLWFTSGWPELERFRSRISEIYIIFMHHKKICITRNLIEWTLYHALRVQRNMILCCDVRNFIHE